MQPVRRVRPYYHTPSYKLAIWTVNPCIPIIIKMHYFNLPWSLAMLTALSSTFCCFIQTPRGIRQWSGNGIPPWSWRTQTILRTVAYRFEWVHILSRCRGLWTAATTLHSAKTSTFESRKFGGRLIHISSINASLIHFLIDPKCIHIFF